MVNKFEQSAYNNRAIQISKCITNQQHLNMYTISILNQQLLFVIKYNFYKLYLKHLLKCKMHFSTASMHFIVSEQLWYFVESLLNFINRKRQFDLTQSLVEEV